MVERGEIRVDWLKREGGGGGVPEETGRMEEAGRGRGGGEEEWRRGEEDGEEDEERRRKKRKRGMGDDAEVQKGAGKEETVEEPMLELTLSLAVPVSPQAEHHHQQTHHPVQENHRNKQNHHNYNLQQFATAGRPHLTASLKHLASQPHPPKLKSDVRKVFGGGAHPRQPIPCGNSPISQFRRPPPPQPALVRSASSSPHPSHEGQDFAPHFSHEGRQASTRHFPSQHSPVPIAPAGQRPLLPQPAHHPRQLVNRVYSRTPVPAVLLPQQSQQRQSGPYLASHIVASQSASVVPSASPQLHSLLQHQSSNAVLVSSHRQTHHSQQQQQQQQYCGAPGFGKNTSAFSAVRPSVVGPIPNGGTDIPPRDRAGDGSIVVSVCDRKVTLTSEHDTNSLYSLLRRWVRNDAPRKDQSVLWDFLPHSRLPSVATADAETEETENETKPEPVKNFQQEETGRLAEEESVPPTLTTIPPKPATAEELLQSHIVRFKKVKTRSKKERDRRIAKYMPRLASLLPGTPENLRREVLPDYPRP